MSKIKAKQIAVGRDGAITLLDTKGRLWRYSLHEDGSGRGWSEIYLPDEDQAGNPQPLGRKQTRAVALEDIGLDDLPF